MRLLTFLCVFLSSTLSWAGGLAAPFSINTTQVLPKGVRSVRVGGLTTTVDGWYNDNGYSTGVAEPFNQQLSYGRLMKAENDEDLKLNVESQLRNKGVHQFFSTFTLQPKVSSNYRIPMHCLRIIIAWIDSPSSRMKR